MSTKNSATVDTCGCCETGIAEPTRLNRPGQSEIAYRLGTHASFLKRMLARLASQELPDGPNAGERPLATLTSRATEDPVVALLDAGAVVYDVLTFYQERIANEGYLRTATERRSILELARSIGYELNPGLAAGTYLVFTVDDSGTTPAEAPIPVGTQVQSIPMAQDELPQTFETTEAFTAQVDWNELKPRLREPHIIEPGVQELYLAGVSTQLQTGDVIVIVGQDRQDDPGSDHWDLRVLQSVKPVPEDNYTLITWKEPLDHLIDDVLVTPSATNMTAEVYVFRQRAALFGFNAPDWRTMSIDVKKAYKPDVVETDPTTWGVAWPNFNFGSSLDPVFPQIDLDAIYAKIVEDSWLALVDTNEVALYKVVAVTKASRTDFALTTKITRVELDTDGYLSGFNRRDTVVYAQSEKLERAEKPLLSPVYGNQIVLDRPVEGLKPGQPLIISGKQVERVEVTETAERKTLALISEDEAESLLAVGDVLQIVNPPRLEDDRRITWHLMTGSGFVGFVTADPDEIIVQPASEEIAMTNEVIFIDQPLDKEGRTTIVLQDPLEAVYDRTTVTLYGNVVPATHGETVANEVLGSGDGAQRNQSFTLNKSPLTYVSAATASGAESTLTLRVNDVAWQGVASLYEQAAQDTVYTVRLDDDGKTRLIFGDGKRGARLPTGQENIRATYRAGLGGEGEVGAKSLTLLKTRPFGVRSVTNPLAATGAADPEMRDAARTNAPLTVLTLDRIVSLRDFEDFARAFTGIGKAKATNVWNGETYLVHLTIADDKGDAVPDTSDLYLNLQTAIDDIRDPTAIVLIDSYTLLTFKLKATISIGTRYLADDLHTDVEAALLNAFSFDQRDFGQPVTAAEVISVIHQVEGVVAVDLDALFTAQPLGSNKADQAAKSKLASVLPAQTARRVGTDILPAELLLIDLDPKSDLTFKSQ